jgi:putative acyl-CoA dehydrogenase
MWNQGENGIGCLNVMSYSIVPLLRANPEVGRDWEPGVLSSRYDARHLPAHQKSGLTVAMSMTEKQGGSDLRRNDTRATPTGSGREYVLRGHKFFCSAPMGDVILLTARTDNGVSLFLAPRLLPDGSHNGTFIQRLKDKLGNRSNASSEIEIDGTVAYLLGEEGHGIREFIQHMTHYIRMDFAVASTGIMRRALVLAAQHVRHRDAFGQRIADLPQMRNVLADLALEWEASLLLGLRMADALDKAPHSPHDHDLLRIGVPVAKFWNCRRVNHVVLEALECHGGMGYVEEQSIARLLREAPLNSIWEGTAAMMGLDLVRALRRHPESKDALLAEIHAGTSGDHRLRALASTLAQDIERAGPDLEAHARRVMGTAAVGLQASLLNRFAPAEVADLFIASRIDRHGGVELGTLPVHGPQLARIAERRSRLTTYIRARTPSYPVLARPRRPPARRASSLRPRTLALPAFRRSHAVRASNFRNSLPIGTWRSAIAAKKCRARYSSRDRQHVYIRVDLQESLNKLRGRHAQNHELHACAVGYIGVPCLKGATCATRLRRLA